MYVETVLRVYRCKYVGYVIVAGLYGIIYLPETRKLQ